MQRWRRLLQQGQPERRKRNRRRERDSLPQKRRGTEGTGRNLRKNEAESRVRGSRRSRGLDRRDLHRPRRRPLRLPELPHPARGGPLLLLRRPRSRRGNGRRPGRHRGLQLLGRLRAPVRQPRLRPPRNRDHRGGRRRRLPQLDRSCRSHGEPRRVLRRRRLPSLLAPRGRGRRHRADRDPRRRAQERDGLERGPRPRRRQRGRGGRWLQHAVRGAVVAARGPRLGLRRLRHRR